MQLATSGQAPQARLAAEQLTQKQPDSWQAWNLLAVIQDHLRQLDEAERSYRRVTQLAPDRSEGWHGLGKVQSAQRELPAAVTSLQRAAALASQDVAILRDLARTFLLVGNVPAALNTIHQARDLAPNCPDVWNLLGLITQQLDQIEEAAVAFCQAVELRPDFVDALANLGECLRTLGQLDQAQQILDRALSLDPQHANALGFSGMLAAMNGQRPRAIELLQAAVERNPRYRLFRLQLARTLVANSQIEAGLQQLAQLQERFGDQPDILLERAGIHAVLCQLDESRDCLDRLLQQQPDQLLARIRRALLVPQIPADRAEIAAVRSHITAQLDRLLSEDLPPLPAPLDDFANTHFYLSYHGENNRSINQKLSQLYRGLYPNANHVHTPLADLRRLQHPGAKIRIAFVSKNFSNHTIGRLNIGLVQGLDRRRFEVTTCVFPGVRDGFQAKFHQASDHFLELSGDPQQAAAMLAEHQPDLIFYTDLGMDPTTYHLAHQRLAPIQFTTWGHPITTGISTIDYFISSDGMDSEASQAHYSEKMVLFRHLLLHYDRPPLLSESVNKSLLGLPDNIRLYLCPQTLFKMHPDFDGILAQILRADPSGLVLMVKLGHETWREKLLARFQRTMPDVAARILWMERMSAVQFQHFFRLGDVALDPYRFGSGNTCLEALSMGIPLVTCPDAYMRTRVAAACYQRMDLSDPVTASPEAYAERVIQIATDRDYHHHLSQQIQQRAEVLFGNTAALRELEGWVESAVNHHSQHAET
jgi:predicted O-linked N-acetylglucosamine transferase (SPINDLY family)